MSKGIGRSQCLVLRALMSLEAQHGSSIVYDGRRRTRAFAVSDIARRCWDLSPDLQARAQVHEDECRAAREAVLVRMKAEAEAGNSLAREWLVLDRSLSAHAVGRRYRGRSVERDIPSFLESRLNPSRALASLAGRKLVWRRNRRGGGWAALTDEGRRAGRRVLAGRIDRCRHLTGGAA